MIYYQDEKISIQRLLKIVVIEFRFIYIDITQNKCRQMVKNIEFPTGGMSAIFFEVNPSMGETLSYAPGCEA